MKNNEILLVFASDDNYAPNVGIAILSLIENANAKIDYLIYILEDGSINKKNKKKIFSLQNENIKIDFKIISNDLCKEFYCREHITSPAYYRVIIPEIFKDYDRAIYSDPDVIFNSDLLELWQLDMSNKSIAAVPCLNTCYIKSERERKYNEICLPPEYKYFYDGNMLLNLKKLRKQKFTEKIFDVAKRESYSNGEMDLINKYFFNEALYLSQKWTFVPLFYKQIMQKIEGDCKFLKEYKKNKYDLYGDEKDSCIIHFAGSVKPWSYYYERDKYKTMYWKYINQSFWKNHFKLKYLNEYLESKKNSMKVNISHPLVFIKRRFLNV